MDTRGKLLLIDPHGARQLGYEQPSQVVGKSVERTFWRGVQDVVDRVLRDGEAELEAHLHHRDGTPRTVRVTLQPLHTDDGTAIAIDGLVRDVTDTVRGEREAMYAREAAEARERLRGRQLSNGLHQLRQSLDALLALEPAYAEPAQRTRAESLAATMHATLNDLLASSRFEAGSLAQDAEAFDLDRMLDEVVDAVSEGRHRALVLAVDPLLPATLVGHRARIQQVLVQLARLTLTAEGGAETVLSVERGRAPDGDAELEFALYVHDSHPHAAPSACDLMVTRELLKAMGSTLEVDAEPPHALRFTLALKAPDATTRVRLLEELRGQRMLLVLPCAAEREAITRCLLATGSTVCAVADAAEAVKALNDADKADRAFALALIDCELEGDGVKLALELAQRTWCGQRPDLLLVSRRPREQAAAGRDLAGVRAFLRKPLSRFTLLDALLDACQARGRTRITSIPPPQGAGEDPSQPLAGLTVLVVEDNEINQILARDLLETAGATVVLASDGQQAIELCKARQVPYDLILMDVQMPGLDGHATTRVLRAEASTARTPIIAMTAHAFDTERKKCLAAGMNAHLAKPINPTELVQTVRKWAHDSGSPALPATSERPAARAANEPAAGYDTSRARASGPTRDPAYASSLMVPGPTATTTALPAFDPSALATVFRDPARQLAFLRKFVDSARATLKELRSAWSRRADAELSFAGHKLKSSAKACGAHALAALCADLEHFARDSNWAELAPLEGRAELLLNEVARHVEELERNRS